MEMNEYVRVMKDELYKRIKESVKQDYNRMMNAPPIVWSEPIPQLVVDGTIDTEVCNENARGN